MLKVTLIGCGGMMPLPNRALSALAITVNGRNILIDCGEGTQAAAKAAGISLFKIDTILLTHYHGDHTFGLPGLLQTIASMNREEPLSIVGPAGLQNALAPILSMCQGLPFKVMLQEISRFETPIHTDTTDSIGTELHQTFGAKVALVHSPVVVTAFPLAHRVPCIGYKIVLPRAGKFLPQKAIALGIPQTQWALLQKGESITLDDIQHTVITPEQVLGAPREGLSIVYGTDSRPCASLQAAAKNANLLLCDCTYGENEQQEKANEFGHSTFAESAQLAAKANAKRFWLTHYSASISDPEEYLANATAHFPQAEIGFDGKTIELAFEAR